MTNIVFDFDGTILDSRNRLYKLFKDLVNDNSLTFERYWELKKAGNSNLQLVEDLYGKSVNKKWFIEEWMANIESDHYLDHDLLYSETLLVINKLKKAGFNLILLTARQFENKVFQQLSKFNLDYHFDKVLVTKQIIDKHTLYKNNYTDNKIGFFVGDTGQDIKSGKLMGCLTIAITHGFQSKETLIKYDPDYIITNLMQVLDAIPYKQ